MWSLLLILLMTPVAWSTWTDYYPPGYYFNADSNATDFSGLFYVEGYASYQTFSKEKYLLSELKPELEALYQDCGAVAIQPQAYLTHARYQRLVVTTLGPRPGSKLVLYISPGSDLHYCALEDPESVSLRCLTPVQQRLVQCLQKKVPPPHQQRWDRIMTSILWAAACVLQALL